MTDIEERTMEFRVVRWCVFCKFVPFFVLNILLTVDV